MLRTASQLFRRQGYAATGWRQVVADSATPWGSQSHHFPGGKEQLAVEAIARSGASYERLLRAAFADASPGDALRSWSETAAAELAASGWSDGCPVATVALEQSHRSELVAQACAAAFESWRVVVGEALRAAGLGDRSADRLATTVLAAIEGALLLARAGRDPAPLRAVGAEMAELVDRLVAEAERSSEPPA